MAPAGPEQGEPLPIPPLEEVEHAPRQAAQVEGAPRPKEDAASPPGRLVGPKELSSKGPKLGFNPLRSKSAPSAPRKPSGSTATSANPGVVGHRKPGDNLYEPIKEDPIFVAWPRPKLALVVTGQRDGYLEPCGCAGLDRMKGGLSRLHSMLGDLRRNRGWTVVALDVGGLVNGFGPQADLKFQATVNALETMHYGAIALGKNELQFDVGLLVFSGTGDQSPFVSANATVRLAPELIPPKRILEAGGMKLGITSVLGKTWQKEVNNQDVEWAAPEEKLAELLPDLKQEADLLILLAHATMKESMALARRFPELDVVLTAGGPAEPPPEPNPIEGSKATLIEVGHKAMYAVVLGFFDDPAQPIRYQRVPLDSRFGDSKEMKHLMAGYQNQLRELGLEGLEIPTVPLPKKELLGKFVGSEECKSCHEESYRVWRKSGHAKAWQTLLDLDPPRDPDPECIACHVVGWHPQEYSPYETGFRSAEKTPKLIDVGCETCHGPGEKHVKAEMGSDLQLQEALRKAAVLTLEDAQQPVSRAASDKQPCRNCHDLDNSPDFNFETYWPKIEHHEDL